MKKTCSLLFFLLLFIVELIAEVHINYLQKSVYNIETQSWGAWQTEAHVLIIEGNTFKINNLSTKQTVNVYQQVSEVVGAYNEKGLYYRLYEVIDQSNNSCEIYLYSDRNAGLLVKCDSIGYMIQYAGW